MRPGHAHSLAAAVVPAMAMRRCVPVPTAVVVRVILMPVAVHLVVHVRPGLRLGVGHVCVPWCTAVRVLYKRVAVDVSCSRGRGLLQFCHWPWQSLVSAEPARHRVFYKQNHAPSLRCARSSVQLQALRLPSSAHTLERRVFQVFQQLGALI